MLKPAMLRTWVRMSRNLRKRPAQLHHDVALGVVAAEGGPRIAAAQARPRAGAGVTVRSVWGTVRTYM